MLLGFFFSGYKDKGMLFLIQQQSGKGVHRMVEALWLMAQEG